jgi:hypothetical protein
MSTIYLIEKRTPLGVESYTADTLGGEVPRTMTAAIILRDNHAARDSVNTYTIKTFSEPDPPPTGG